MPTLYFTQQTKQNGRVFFSDETPIIGMPFMPLTVPASMHFKATNTPKDTPVYIFRIFVGNLIHASIFGTLQDATKALLTRAAAWQGKCFLTKDEMRPFIQQITQNGDKPTHLSQYRHISKDFFPLDGELLTVCPVYKA